MAEKIQQAFGDEVLTTFCPNSTDIVIYSRIARDEETNEPKANKLTEEINILCRPPKKGKRKKETSLDSDF
jgi:hypothetical protein